MCGQNARAIVYVDGFNLYYGLLKNSPHKWLDLQRLFEFLRPHDDIQAIKYFTSIVEPGPRRNRQEVLLRALGTRPLVQPIFGRFKKKKITCRCPGCTQPAGNRPVFRVPEEKCTDVNIALNILDDAYQGLCERQVLVSGDSDLVPAIQTVRQRFPGIRTTVYVPARDRRRRAALELRQAAHKHNTLPPALLQVSQMPAQIPDGAGGVIHKPQEW